ncbi:MAG: MBL fold metallo-hydrolase [Promethearchaeota archaeon]
MNSIDFSFKITKLFDNDCAKDGFLTGFGFSVLIFNNFTQNYLLFDVGQNGNILNHNINKLGIDILKISKLIISHNHFDHAGGLKELLQINPKIRVYVPKDAELVVKRKFSDSEIYGISELTEIEEHIFSSGQLGTHIKEQALYLETLDNKFILIVGCTHPGLENFILKARKTNDIKAVIGGFHGFKKYSYLEGIEFLFPCHCTQNKGDIKRRYPNQFRKICVGDSLKF